MSAALVVNGRFLSAPLSGLQRTAGSLVRALSDQGVLLEVVAPHGVRDPRADRLLPVPGGRAGGQVFEQVLLPLHARGRLLLSPANLAPVAGRGSVVVVHDLAPLVGPQWFARSMAAYVRVVLAAARRAELVLTVSSAVAGELVTAGVPPDRVRVLRWAVDPAFVPASPDDVARVRAAHGLHRPYVMTVGWADPRKDVATALAASAMVRPSQPHDLVLVGRRHPVFAAVPQPRGDGVRVLGHVPDGDLQPLLTGAAALLYPTRYEGFGLPPLEAAACGTPAVVSDLPVLRETGGAGAVYVPPGDVAGFASGLEAALQGRLASGPLDDWSWADTGRQVVGLLRPLGLSVD